VSHGDTAAEDHILRLSAATAESRDAALLQAVAFRQDCAAFEELYRLHIGAVMHAATQICRNKTVAEEIAQRTFTTLWQRAGRLASKSLRLRPWLVTVARNASIDHIRLESAYVPLADTHLNVPAVDRPDDEAITNALIADLAPALASLPARQRIVLELRYFEGLSFPAIARQTDEALETVKSRARLGIARLRRLLT
jgi:RNA polymerase sigma-70 factor (ECF subfamily)